jgi:hypothetical protein
MLEVELGKSVESELGLFLEFFGPCQPVFFQALLFWALVLYCVLFITFFGLYCVWAFWCFSEHIF